MTSTPPAAAPGSCAGPSLPGGSVTVGVILAVVPIILVEVVVIVVVSLLLAPRRGVVWQRLAARRRAGELRLGSVLAGLDRLAHEHGDGAHAHPAAVVSLLAGADATARLEELERRGWATQSEEGWAVTERGRVEARRREDAR